MITVASFTFLSLNVYICGILMASTLSTHEGGIWEKDNERMMTQTKELDNGFLSTQHGLLFKTAMSDNALGMQSSMKPLSQSSEGSAREKDQTYRASMADSHTLTMRRMSPGVVKVGDEAQEEGSVSRLAGSKGIGAKGSIHASGTGPTLYNGQRSDHGRFSPWGNLSGPRPFVGYLHGANQTRLAPVPGLPDNFDWKAYIDYNPDVRASGIHNFKQVAAHYRLYGHRENRLYQRIPLLVRYTACGGLMNQHYSHIAALTIASALGGDVMLAPALQRGSFSQIGRAHV